MYNKKRRAQPQPKRCVGQSTRHKKNAPPFKLPYNLRSKTNDVVPLNTLSENNTQSDLCTEKILRRSKRIHQKNNVHLKIYDCVSDYYMQMQTKSDGVFTNNNQYNLSSTKDTFCETLQTQLSHVKTSHTKTKSLQLIKTLVANIDAFLESNNKAEPKNQWSFEVSHGELDIFNVGSSFEPLFQEENVFVDEYPSPQMPFDFLKGNVLVEAEREESFSFDEDVFLPTMPTLKSPPPLKFYPRMMHNV
ncbi:hypothetical protein RN001_011261 [Aquatica leii]|uniref:Uncharacterized protein n=1 Tax=Aquatica leii TaxID=1421715 RepID=A0AAN7P227_9COLE|nr:hypothetical protein RN001_011261 [Aquatica leii]